MATIGGTPQFTGQVQGFAVGSLSFASTQGAAQGVAPPQLSSADLQRIIAGAFVALQQLGNTWGGVAGGQVPAQTYQPFGNIQPGLTVPGGNIAPQTYEPFGNFQPGLTVPGGNIAPQTYEPFGNIQPGINVPGGIPRAETYQPFGNIQPGITVPGGVPGPQTFQPFGNIQPNIQPFGFPGIGAQTYESFGQPPMAFPGSFVSPFQQQNIDPFAGAYSAQNPFATPTNTTDAVLQYALASMDPIQAGQFVSIQTPMDAPPIVAQQQSQGNRENHEAHENHGQHHGHHKHHHHHNQGQPPVAGTPPQAPGPQPSSPYSSGFPSPYGGPRRF